MFYFFEEKIVSMIDRYYSITLDLRRCVRIGRRWFVPVESWGQAAICLHFFHAPPAPAAIRRSRMLLSLLAGSFPAVNSSLSPLVLAVGTVVVLESGPWSFHIHSRCRSMGQGQGSHVLLSVT